MLRTLDGQPVTALYGISEAATESRGKGQPPEQKRELRPLEGCKADTGETGSDAGDPQTALTAVFACKFALKAWVLRSWGMTKSIDGNDIGGTVERLRQVFERNTDPQQASQSVARIIEDVNIVDRGQPEGSAWRNRPLHMVLAASAEHTATPREIAQQERRAKVAQMAKDGTLPPKNWDAPKPTQKQSTRDWSKLSR